MEELDCLANCQAEQRRQSNRNMTNMTGLTDIIDITHESEREIYFHSWLEGKKARTKSNVTYMIEFRQFVCHGVWSRNGVLVLLMLLLLFNYLIPLISYMVRPVCSGGDQHHHHLRVPSHLLHIPAGRISNVSHTRQKHVWPVGTAWRKERD